MDSELITLNSNTIYQIDIDMIQVDPDHPFLLHEDSQEYQDIKDSISEIGIITPLVLLDDGSDNSSYRLICGMRRLHIAQSLGYKTVPCIILSNVDEYTLNRYRNDSNFQTRQFILPSEKAHAYKLELDALKRQGKRIDLTSAPLERRLETAAIIGEEFGESRAQVRRYVRLNKLIPPLIKMVDDGRLSVRTAGDYAQRLTLDNQKMVAKNVSGSSETVVQSRIIAVVRAQEKAQKEGRKISEDEVVAALKDPNPKPKVTKDLVIPGKIVEELFGDLYSKEKQFQLDYTIAALKYYMRHEKEGF